MHVYTIIFSLDNDDYFDWNDEDDDEDAASGVARERV